MNFAENMVPTINISPDKKKAITPERTGLMIIDMAIAMEPLNMRLQNRRIMQYLSGGSSLPVRYRLPRI